jgi:hypothetical protein
MVSCDLHVIALGSGRVLGHCNAEGRGAVGASAADGEQGSEAGSSKS